MINNVIYVIFLSAAADILEHDPSIRKSTVLLANILPCLFVKLTVPYFIRVIPYGFLIFCCVLLSMTSLHFVAWLDPMWMKFSGIILASASSGLGETAFLALTTYYQSGAVVAWSSGTGAAGLVGAFYYLIVTSVMGFSMQVALTIASLLPLVMAAGYWLVLIPEHHVDTVKDAESSSLSASSDSESTLKLNSSLILERFFMIRPLLFRYIMPLFLVYFSEYTINQSVYFALFYPLAETPFKRYNDHYDTYNAFYQLGVFISRTFGRRLFPVKHVWIFAVLQMAMLLVMSGELFYSYLNNIYAVLVLVVVEGLLGGAAYVNTFCNIREDVPKEATEFSMAFTGIADSLGIALAGVFCLVYEPFLCSHNDICTVLRNPPPIP